MSQFDEVSNIANPTFDAELAISMTVNAKLPKTPQRQSRPAGASDLTLDSVDNKDPIGRAEPGVNTRRISTSNGGQRSKFQGAAVRKQPRKPRTKELALTGLWNWRPRDYVSGGSLGAAKTTTELRVILS
jgi:hypothetical protein